MEEIISEFRTGQLHFRKTLIFSMVVVLVLFVVSFMYLNNLEHVRGGDDYNFSSGVNKSNYFLMGTLISTTTDNITFNLIDDSTKLKHTAYFDGTSKNNLATSTKIGDTITIYSKTPVQDDQDGFIINRIDNYTE